LEALEHVIGCMS